MTRKKRLEIDRTNKTYSFFKLDIGVPNAYLALNRKYLPLTVENREWIDYTKYAMEHGYYVCDRPAHLLPVWIPASGEKQMWLYNDEAESRVDYDTRRAVLFHHCTFVKPVAEQLND